MKNIGLVVTRLADFWQANHLANVVVFFTRVRIAPIPLRNVPGLWAFSSAYKY